jgi:mRNA interferase MazF
MMEYRRGDVLMVHLEPVEGSEQGGTRPVVVVSNDRLNRRLPLLTVAPITSRNTKQVHLTEVIMEPPDGGLRQVSKVLLHQLRTIAGTRVARKMGSASSRAMAAIDKALHLTLDLP